MTYNTSIQRFISVLLITPMMFFQVPSATAFAAPAGPKRSVSWQEPALMEARRKANDQTIITSARKALTDLARGIHALKTSGDERTFDEALVSLDRRWTDVQRLLQLAGDDIQRRASHPQRVSLLCASRIDAAQTSFVRSSMNLQREYDSFQRQARLGMASARTAVERFESALSTAAGLTNSASVTNPLPHRSPGHPPGQSGPRIGTPVRPPAHGGSPTHTQFSSTEDATITQEVQALADQLQHDPVRIFSYVRNQVAFDPYYGSRKGSLLTLWGRSGNDVDIASLLIALYRASGVQARYVQGTVSIDPSVLRNWVGNAADLDSALAILKSGGIPVDIQNGTPLIQHVWVELYDVKSSAWVGVDASFKQFRYAEPINISQTTGFDAAGFVNRIRSENLVGLNDQLQSFQGRPTVASVTDPQDDKQAVDLTQNTIAGAVASLNQTLTASSTTESVFGGTYIVQQEMAALPSALPLAIASGTPVSRFSEVPDSIRDKITIAISSADDSSAGFSYQASYPSLANKRIVVSYEPASDYDAESIRQSSSGTQLTADSFFGVSLVPVLRINGNEVARGGPVAMGAKEIRSLTITDALGNSDTASNTVFAGGMFAVGLGYGRTSPAEMTAAQIRLQAARAVLPLTSSGVPDANDPANLSEPVIGETLNLMMQAWFNQSDTYNELVSRSRGVRWFRGPSAGVAGFGIVFSFLFGINFGTSGGNLFFDIAHNVVHSVSLKGSPSDAVVFMETTGMFGSGLEHALLELLGNRSLSTIRLMSLALSQGKTIYRIDSSNRDQVLPKLGIFGAALTQITDALDKGQAVTIFDSEVAVGGWSGFGYIIVDPTTGGAGYYISGGLQSNVDPTCGGSVVEVIKTVAAYSLASFNVALNMFGFVAAVSLLAPEASLLGLAAAVLTAQGLSMSISDLNALSVGSTPASKYITDALSSLLVGGVLAAVGIGAVGLAEDSLATSAASQLSTYIADLDMASGGGATTLVEAGFSQEEVALMAVNGLETKADFQAVADFTQRFGSDVTRRLFSNPFYAPGEEYTAGDLARLALNAPDEPGLADTVKKAVAQNNKGFLTEIQLADSYRSKLVGYNGETTVEFTEATGLDNNGVPILGGKVTEKLEGDLILQGNEWIEVKNANLARGSAQLDLANQILKGQQAISNGTIKSYTIHSTMQVPFSLWYWAYQNAPDVKFAYGIPGTP